MTQWMKKNETAVSISFLILLAILCFIPLSNQTGYYLNDWHPLAGKLKDTSLFQMWASERVGVGLLYSLTYPILGDNLFGWQLFSIGLRLISALGFWWLIRSVWKKERYFSVAAASLFLVYPGFMEQSIALTFSNHFIGINCAIFSIVFTVKALQAASRIKKISLTALAILLEIAYIINYEYMLGYEVVRIIFIWYLTCRPFELKTIWQSAKKLFINSLPYLSAVGLFLFWRVFLFNSSRSTTNVGLLARKYLSNPGQMTARIFLETIRDMLETIWLSWSVPFNQVGANASYGNLAISILLGVLAAALLFFLVKIAHFEKFGSAENTDVSEFKSTPYQDSIWIGLIAVVVALLPVIVADREVKFNNQMDRYTLHAALGVGLFTAGLIFHWVKNSGRKIILAFLLMIGVMTQFNSTVAYATWWDYQTSLWWQLAWRAPDLKDDTVIMPLLPYGNRLQEDIEVWTPANAIYRPDQTEVVITAEVINPDTAINVFFKEQTYRNFRNSIQYSRDFNYPLIISYPSGGSCAHIIDGDRLELSLNDEPIIYRVAAFSRIDQIVVNASPHIPPKQIFGTEPAHDWCYFYQKANLYRQQEDWESGAALGDEVLASGHSPQDVTEWLPFVEIYLENGQPEKARQLVQMINNDQSATKNLCAVWEFNKPHENSQLMDMVCAQVN